MQYLSPHTTSIALPTYAANCNGDTGKVTSACSCLLGLGMTVSPTTTSTTASILTDTVTPISIKQTTSYPTSPTAGTSICAPSTFTATFNSTTTATVSKIATLTSVSTKTITVTATAGTAGATQTVTVTQPATDTAVSTPEPSASEPFIIYTYDVDYNEYYLAVRSLAGTTKPNSANEGRLISDIEDAFYLTAEGHLVQQGPDNLTAYYFATYGVSEDETPLGFASPDDLAAHENWKPIVCDIVPSVELPSRFGAIACVNDIRIFWMGCLTPNDLVGSPMLYGDYLAANADCASTWRPVELQVQFVTSQSNLRSVETSKAGRRSTAPQIPGKINQVQTRAPVMAARQAASAPINIWANDDQDNQYYLTVAQQTGASTPPNGARLRTTNTQSFYLTADGKLVQNGGAGLTAYYTHDELENAQIGFASDSTIVSAASTSGDIGFLYCSLVLDSQNPTRQGVLACANDWKTYFTSCLDPSDENGSALLYSDAFKGVAAAEACSVRTFVELAFSFVPDVRPDRV
jgi:hypothetical protein